VTDRGLDADKLAALERWATGLQGDARPEVAASGKAILMLIEEIEHLHVLLWGRSLYPQEPVAAPTPEPEQPDVARALRRRLRIHRRREDVEAPAEPPEVPVIHSESTTS
jgi:hypothetical protein